MLKYILKRLLAGVLTMVVLITVAFFMMHAMPGGPFSPSEEKNVPKQVLERIAASYGLDQPVWKQYLNYWKNLLNGDLGVSYKTIGTVNEKIANHFPYSARVGGLAVVFSLLVLVFMDPLLRLLGASENTRAYGRQYLMAAVVVGGVPTVLSMCDRVYRVVEKKITQLSREEIEVITRNF